MLDRLTTRFRAAFMIAAIVALPVSLLAYGKFIILFFDAYGPWWTAGVGLANIIVLVGIGCLLDDLQLRQSARERAQQSRPDRR